MRQVNHRQDARQRKMPMTADHRTTAFAATAFSYRSYTRTVITCSDGFAGAATPVTGGFKGASKANFSVSESEIWPTGCTYCHGPASTEYSACAIGVAA